LVAVSEDLCDTEQVQLRERVKELQCLYRVAALSQRADCSVEEYLGAIPDLLPAGWFYPEISAARIQYRGQVYQTENFRETPWKLNEPLTLGDHEAGSLEIVYLEERPLRDQGPFLVEEKELLHALATHLGEALQNKELELRLRRTQRLEALGFVAGGVAHDFNNFLSVISMVAEHAQIKEGRGQPVAAELQEILSVVERSSRLANRLVGFVGSQGGEVEAVCLNTTLRECRGMLERLLNRPTRDKSSSGPATQVELRLDLEPDLALVRLQTTQLDQLLVNLAANAREAMPDGGTFEVATRNLPGGKVLLACVDSGCGMSKETLARLFEPFYTTKGYGGGLGLATVESIVANAGGEISVTSAPGQGSRFELTFPAQAANSAAPTAPEPPTLATVLLVDDEPSLRYLCERLLGSMGYHVISAETAEEALSVARSHKGVIDLLLTDLTLPDMNGRQLSEQLHFERPETLTLLMSGYRTEVVAETAGDYPFLQKPFTREDLGRCLHQILESNPV
jgi:signal transduction histidine kinase